MLLYEDSYYEGCGFVFHTRRSSSYCESAFFLSSPLSFISPQQKKSLPFIATIPVNELSSTVPINNSHQQFPPEVSLRPDSSGPKTLLPTIAFPAGTSMRRAKPATSTARARLVFERRRHEIRIGSILRYRRHARFTVASTRRDSRGEGSRDTVSGFGRAGVG